MASRDMTLAAVVQHVKVLEHSGIISTTKTGRVRTCRLAPEGLEAAERWIIERRALWQRRLDRLGAFLDEKESSPKTRKKSGSRVGMSAALDNLVALLERHS